MKFLLSLIVLGIFYIDTATSYISSSSPPSGGAAPWKNGAKPSFAQPPPSNIVPDDIFREEYHAWGKRYGKSTGDKARFENFKLNFMLQMQHNKKTGTFNLLNEFGDMTAKEFESNVTNNGSRTEVRTTNLKESSDSITEVELMVGEEFIPRVRTLDSDSIPRMTPFGSPTSTSYAKSRNRQRQRPNSSIQKVSLEASPSRARNSGRDTAYTSTRPPAYGSQDQQQAPSSEQRIYRQDQVITQSPRSRRKRRLVGIGPDKIL